MNNKRKTIITVVVLIFIALVGGLYYKNTQTAKNNTSTKSNTSKSNASTKNDTSKNDTSKSNTSATSDPSKSNTSTKNESSKVEEKTNVIQDKTLTEKIVKEDIVLNGQAYEDGDMVIGTMLIKKGATQQAINAVVEKYANELKTKYKNKQVNVQAVQGNKNVANVTK